MCSPTRPSAQQANELSTKNPRSCTLVVYIAGDTLRHQPMGAGHMTVLQLRGPMPFCVLQWCHPMLASTKRTSCCTLIITLYSTRKWIQARAPTPLANDICWPSLETCSNLFTSEPPFSNTDIYWWSIYIRHKWAALILLECFLVPVNFVHCKQYKLHFSI